MIFIVFLINILFITSSILPFFLFSCIFITLSLLDFFLFSCLFIFSYFFTSRIINLNHALNFPYIEKLIFNFNLKPPNKILYCQDNATLDNEIMALSKKLCNDYIDVWYKNLSTNTDFQNDCYEALNIILGYISSKICNIDKKIFIYDSLRVFCYFSKRSSNLSLITSDKERKFIKASVDKLLTLCSTNTSLNISPKIFELLNENHKEDPFYKIIRDLLTDAAFIPIINIISEPQWINYCLLRVFGINCQISINTFSQPEYVDKTCINKDENLLQPSSSNSSIILDEKKNQNLLELGSNLSDRSKSSCYDDKNENLQEVECLSGKDVSHIKIFKDIHIIDNKEVSDSKETYTLYKISCSALYEEEIQDSIEAGHMYPILSSLIRKDIFVERRFREFVELEYQLEENHQFKHYLKKLKKPSSLRILTPKLFFLPKKKIDSTTLMLRKNFLEKYLNDLCHYRPIAESIEIRNFLGYFHWISSKHNRIVKPFSLNRVLMHGMSSSLSVMKLALQPTSPQTGEFVAGPGIVDSKSLFLSLKLIKHQYTAPSVISKLMSKINIQSLKSDNYSENIEKRNLGRIVCFSDDIKDGSKAFKEISEIPLTNSLFNTFFKAFVQEHHFKKLFYYIQFFFGKALEKYIIKLIDEWATRKMAIHILHSFHETIWPEKTPEINPVNLIPSSDLLICAICKYLKKKMLFKFIPYNTIFKNVKRYVEKFQSKNINKLFVYSLLNVIIGHITSGVPK